MIEVEKKFQFTPAGEKRLIKEADFISEKKIHDIYYDTSDYSLTTKDWWLRRRDEGWELKQSVVFENQSRRKIDRYHELEDEASIRQAIHLPHSSTLITDLGAAGYRSFADLTTTRRKFQWHEFEIVLDRVEFPDFSCGLGEIELMVEKEADTKNAMDKILKAADHFGFQIDGLFGKMMQYIKARRPEHFQALVRAGVVEK